MRWGHGCEPLHRGFAVGGRGLRAPWAGRAPDVAPKVQAAVPVAGPVEVAPLHAEPARAARSGAVRAGQRVARAGRHHRAMA